MILFTKVGKILYDDSKHILDGQTGVTELQRSEGEHGDGSGMREARQRCIEHIFFIARSGIELYPVDYSEEYQTKWLTKSSRLLFCDVCDCTITR